MAPPKKRPICRRRLVLTTMAAVAVVAMRLESVALAPQASTETRQLAFVRTSAGSGVRPVDRIAAVLLQNGATRSATFRTMIETLERSDLIVFVETRALPPKVEGRLQLMAAGRDCRYIRISVGIPGFETDLVGWLAHELHHAVEVAGAPEIRDQQSLLRFYHRVGFVHENAAETLEAQQTQRVVPNEMRKEKFTCLVVLTGKRRST